MKLLLLLLMLVPLCVVAQDKVGIGTETPLAKLDISAEGNGVGILRLSTERPWVFKQRYNGADTRLSLQPTSNLKRFEILSFDGSNRAAEFLLMDAGSRVLLVPEGGDVGIGVNTPAGKLHIFQNSTFNYPQLRITEEGADFGRIKFESSVNPGAFWDIAARADTVTGLSRMNFFFINDETSGDRMTIMGDGKVGIGTINPAARLDIAGIGDGIEVLKLSTERPWVFKQRLTGPVTKLTLQPTTNLKRFEILSNNGTNRAAEFFLSDASSSVFLVPDGGKVGIGTDNPAELLHINGTLRVNDLAGAGDRNVIVDANGKFKIGSLGAGDSDWTETATNVYNNTHNIGIGTSNPSAKLMVIGAENNGTNGGLKIVTPGTPPFYSDATTMLFDGNEIDVLGTINNTLYMQFNSTGGIQMVQGGGGVGIGGIPSGIKKVQITGQSIPSTGDIASAAATLSIVNNVGGISEMLLDGNEIQTVDETLFLNSRSAKNVIIGSGGGNIAIGTENMAAGYKLSVGGKIIAEEVRVQLVGAWPDYVFEEEYPLMPLEEVKKSIQRNKHLPGIPPAKEVDENGLHLGDMQQKMMQKIEELTLYLIEVNTRLKVLETENHKLKIALKLN